MELNGEVLSVESDIKKVLLSINDLSEALKNAKEQDEVSNRFIRENTEVVKDFRYKVEDVSNRLTKDQDENIKKTERISLAMSSMEEVLSRQGKQFESFQNQLVSLTQDVGKILELLENKKT
jgi:chromosome segregation ATPase